MSKLGRPTHRSFIWHLARFKRPILGTEKLTQSWAVVALAKHVVVVVVVVVVTLLGRFARRKFKLHDELSKSKVRKIKDMCPQILREKCLGLGESARKSVFPRLSW